MLFSVLTRKDEIPRLNFPPQRSGPGWKNGVPAQATYLAWALSSSSSLVPPAVPGPGALLGPSSQRSAQPTSLRQPGAQAPHGDHCRVPRTATHGDRTIRWRRWGWRGRLLTLQGLSLASGPSWWGWSPAGQSSVCPRPPSSPTGWDRRVPGRRLYLPLTTLSAPRTMPCWP